MADINQASILLARTTIISDMFHMPNSIVSVKFFTELLVKFSLCECFFASQTIRRPG